MKVLVDTTEFTPNRKYASIPLYIIRFLSAIKLENRKDFVLLINSESKAYFCQNYPEYKFVECNFKGYHSIFRKNPYYLYTKYKFDNLIKKLQCDIFFTPTDYPYYFQDKIPCKKVIVIHDLKAIKRNCKSIKDSLRIFNYYKMYERHLKSADKIIAISKYTKQDIIKHYPIIEDNKIEVIYNSVEITNLSQRPNNFSKNNYLLYVNTLLNYKNVKTLIKAFHRLSNKISNDLVIVGKTTQYWNEVIKPIIKEYNLEERVVHLQNLTNEELKFLYENASLFITPSLNEGFGYTPIEAAICKCPVICSIEEALPDSTQGLVNYYQPAMDDVSLAKKIYEILQNPPKADLLNKISNYFQDLYSPQKQELKICNLFLKLSCN